MPVRKLRFPIGGLNRRYGYQSTPPFYTADCLNVRPFDTEEGRERGGSRPGLKEALPSTLPGPPSLAQKGGRHLWTVDVVPKPDEVDREFTWFDEFDDWQVGDVWTVGGESLSESNDLLTFVGDSSLVRDVLEGFAADKPYSIRLTCAPSFVGDYIGRYILWASLGPDSWENGVHMAVELALTPSPIAGRPPSYIRSVSLVTLVAGQALTVAFRTMTLPSDSWAILEHNEQFIIHMDVDAGHAEGAIVNGHVERVSEPLVAEGTSVKYFADVGRPFPPIGSQVGFSAFPGGTGLDSLKVDRYEITYTATSVTAPFFDKPRPVLVAIDSTGQLHSNRVAGRMAIAADVDRLSLNTPKSAAAFLGKLYIADPIRGPMVFDPALNVLYPWVVDEYGAGHPQFPRLKGEMPKPVETTEGPRHNHLLTRYLGRMVLAGAPEHVVWMSRAGDPHDFDFIDVASGFPSDTERATWSAGTDEWGAHPGAITALIAFSDDYLLIGQRDSITRLVGDPLAGGQFVNVTQAVGILDRDAWCITPESELVFMANEGLFLLAPGGTSFPVAISREILPRELLNIDPLVTKVVLVYDRVASGIHIFVLLLSGGGNKHWWFDWRTKSFWPVSLDSSHVPWDAVWYDGDSRTLPGVILGCRDGPLRVFSDSSYSDAGLGFLSHCDYGPVRLASHDSKHGVLNSVRVFNPRTSGDVKVEVRVGDFPEAAYRADVVHSEVANGRAIRVKRGGSAAYVRVSGVGERDPRNPRGSLAARAWQMENVEVDVAQVGPAKPL